jgi:heme A synthase
MTPSTPITPFGRVFAGALGVLFVGLAAVILATSPELDWRTVLGAVIVLVLGLDFLLGAVRSRWPRLALVLF